MNILDAIRAAAKDQYAPRSYSGTVKEVNQDGAVVVPADGGPEHYGVQYSATGTIQWEPLEGSRCVVLDLGKYQQHMVWCDELDYIRIEFGDIRVELDASGVEITADQAAVKVVAGGIEITRAGQNLSAVLANLCTQIQAITVPTPAGPSGPPVNAAAFASISQQITSILQ